MTTDIDRILATWLSDVGPARAPEHAVRAALVEVAGMPERRMSGSVRQFLHPVSSDRPITRRTLAVVGLLLLAAAVLGVAIGAQILRPPPATSDSHLLTAPDGSFELRLPIAYRLLTGDDPTAGYAGWPERKHVLSARSGDARGQIRTCDAPAGPWEECLVRRATTLDELSAAFSPESQQGPGIGPPIVARQTATLDGEPAMVYEIEAYEYPARGAEFVTYILAMHDGRPFAIRIWTGHERGINNVSEIMAGFRFLD